MVCMQIVVPKYFTHILIKKYSTLLQYANSDFVQVVDSDALLI